MEAEAAVERDEEVAAEEEGEVEAAAERDYRPVAVLGAMVLLYLVVFGTLTWRQQSNYGTFGFDHGFFDQQIWLASRFKFNPFVTIGGVDLYSNHINPIVYLVAPFYWFGAGPHFLYLLQTACFAGGAVPLWLIARDRFGDAWLALGIPAAWLLYPSVQWMTWWHFHPETLAVPPFLFAWWFATKGRWRWFAVCVVLVLATKEDAALAVMGLGLVVAIKHERRAGLLTIGAAAVWFVICMKLIIPFARGTSDPFYADRFASLGTTTNEIAYNAIRHPSRILELVFAEDRQAYWVKMFAPVGALVVMAPVVLLIAVPTLLINVVSSWGYAHEIKYQYQVSVSVGIFIALVEAIGRHKNVTLRGVLVGFACACALASSLVWGPSPLNPRVYRGGTWALHRGPLHTALDHAVSLVPKNAGVSATYSVIPHLAHRVHAYEWPNPFRRANYGVGFESAPEHPKDVQYLVLIAGYNADDQLMFDDLTRPGGEFKVIFQRDGAIVAKRVRPPRHGVRTVPVTSTTAPSFPATTTTAPSFPATTTTAP